VFTLRHTAQHRIRCSSMAKLGDFCKRWWLLDAENLLKIKGQLFSRVARSPEVSAKLLNIPSAPVQKTTSAVRLFLQNPGTPLKLKVNKFYHQHLGRSHFFRKDFIWRKARWGGSMLGFVGIGCFQEDVETSNKKTDVQYKIYDGICKDIKTFFPDSVGTNLLNDDEGASLQDFQLCKQLTCHPDGVQYEATLAKDCYHDFTDDEDSIVQLEHEEFSVESLSSCAYLPPIVSHANKKFLVNVVFNREKCTVFPNFRGNTCNFDATERAKQPLDQAALDRSILPYHPNIVSNERVFYGKYPIDEDAYFPLNKAFGKHNNLSMFIVTKRPDSSLKDHLQFYHRSYYDKSMMILQILEAVSHLERHFVAHRQIDMNSFVVDDDGDFPRVLLTNFTEAFQGKSPKGLLVPFEHSTLDTRVMSSTWQAPEVSASKAGRGCVVDYRKSDAWNAGLLALQILTDDYEGHLTVGCRSELQLDLINAPVILKNLVNLLLQENPDDRLSACEAADILHLDLFAQPPSTSCSLKTYYKHMRSWLVGHCAEAMARKRHDPVVFDICRSFFTRMDSRKLFTNFQTWLFMQYNY